MPLAHILAPAIARRALETKAALEPPMRAGYLHASAPPTASDKAIAKQRAMPKKSPREAANDIVRDRAYKRRVSEKHLKLPEAPGPQRPGASAGTDEVIGMDESGRPIYASVPAAAPAKKGRIQIGPGAVGMNERGEAVTARGRKLGYLNASGSPWQPPAVVAPGGSLPMRTGERHAGDVGPSADAPDAFAIEVLRRRYGEHLKEMEANRDADGLPTDRFPEGYFGNMKQAEIDDIVDGTRALQAIERGQPI